jgi:carbonic anhydrase
VIGVEYTTCNATIRNTGHDIEVTPACDENKTNKITIGDNVYKLVQLHFHVPSEHSIPGVAAVAEMHILHQLIKGSGDENAVIGVMLTKGNEYPALKPVFANLPETVCAATKLLPIEFDQLLPKTKFGYYTYAGSLTTPPCTPSVIWYVLGAPQTILGSDWEKLRALGANARPIQTNRPPLPVTYVRP